MKKKRPNRYSAILEAIFLKKYFSGVDEIEFTREEINVCALELGFKPPKNLGDVVYSFRYRLDDSGEIAKRAPEGWFWTIYGTGRGNYAFRLVRLCRLEPRENWRTIKIPDATPEIVAAYAQGDEQALLAKIRYNRLIDLFLGVAAFSLQNHLRTSVKGIGQIEIDEVYVAVDKNGVHYIIPVQAKGGKDKSGVVQTSQDVAWCRANFPNLVCVPITTQFIDKTKIAMFRLCEEDGAIVVVDEKHYRLVPSQEISDDDLKAYRVGTDC